MTNRQAIKEHLLNHPRASRKDIAAATGRKIHYPDLTFVKRELGLLPQKVRRRKKAKSVKVVTQAVRTPDGTVLLGAVLDLAKAYGGIKRLKKAVDAISSF